MKTAPFGLSSMARFTISKTSAARLESRGHRFHSRTDAEVIIHLYEEDRSFLS